MTQILQSEMHYLYRHNYSKVIMWRLCLCYDDISCMYMCILYVLYYMYIQYSMVVYYVITQCSMLRKRLFIGV